MTINPELYSLAFPSVVWILAGVALLSMIVIALIWWPRFLSVSRRVKADDATELPEDPAAFPPVSVVVHTRGDARNLCTLLPQILEQDYPAPMEVIVVNDFANDETATIVAQLEMEYPNLYMTFAPERSRSLSRRKLCITLGIKAARYDVVVFTSGNCRIESPYWLQRMTSHLADYHKDIVIGYARPWGEDEPDTDARRRRRAFDDQWADARYLSAAIHGHTYMGTGYNLAYRRRIFFDHKGFSRTLNLNYGDDDIFIHEIATPTNTAVELSHEGRVRADEHSPAWSHDSLRCRRDFTARYLPRTPYLLGALSSWAWWVSPACAVAAAVLALPSLVVAAGLFILGLTFGLTHQIIYRKCARALELRSLFWTVPWLSLMRPLRTLRHIFRGRRQRRDNFTYSK